MKLTPTLFRKLIVALLLTTSFQAATAQWQEIDVVSELDSTRKPTPVIYLTATWCSPCMQKLQTVIDSFGHNPNKPLFVVFDRLGLSPEKQQRLAEKYDTSYFRTLLAMYSPQHVKKFMSIDVNSANTVMKNLTADMNNTWGTRFKKDDIWVGQALLLDEKNKVYVTKTFKKEELVKEIQQVIVSK